MEFVLKLVPLGIAHHNRQSTIRNRHASAVAEFTGPDGGKTAHYMVKWLSTRSEAGPWSETASATIGA
jgi:hypothetical protein